MTATACVFVRDEIDLPSLFDGVSSVLTEADPSAPAATERRICVSDGEISYEPSQGLPALAWVAVGMPSEWVPPHSARAYFDAPLCGGYRYVLGLALRLCDWLTARGYKCGLWIDRDYRYVDFTPEERAAARGGE